jgi:2',3'-cyclic-nucleotide 2'-phosphodiesterase (5'-nucleotidase family)
MMVDSTLDAIQDTTYLQYLTPIKAELEQALNTPIGYAPEIMIVHQPECNMLNWACDALWAMAQQRYPEKVDMAVVNIGGMRCEWAAGDITQRHIFELMPFDNELVVLTMTGDEILNLCNVFIQRGGEGVAGLRMKARNGKLISATIAGKPILPTAYYTVATSDYLSQGNDGMTPLAQYQDMWRSEEKIRDLYIEYVQQVKTVQAVIDGRMDIQ